MVWISPYRSFPVIIPVIDVYLNAQVNACTQVTDSTCKRETCNWNCGLSHCPGNPWSACWTNWGAVGQQCRRPPLSLTPRSSVYLTTACIHLFEWGVVRQQMCFYQAVQRLWPCLRANVLWLRALPSLSFNLFLTHAQRMVDLPESGLWLTWYSPDWFL